MPLIEPLADLPPWIPLTLNALLFLAIASIVYYGIRLGITPMPSSNKAVQAMLSLIPDGTTGKIVDLGSGWGGLAFPIAKRFPNAAVEGYELSPVPLLYSRLKAALVRRPNLTLRRGDVFQVDLRDVDVVVVFLHPAAMRKLGPKFERELRPGTLALSNTFEVPAWQPERVCHLGRRLFTTSTDIYVYRV